MRLLRNCLFVLLTIELLLNEGADVIVGVDIDVMLSLA